MRVVEWWGVVWLICFNPQQSTPSNRETVGPGASTLGGFTHVLSCARCGDVILYIQTGRLPKPCRTCHRRHRHHRHRRHRHHRQHHHRHHRRRHHRHLAGLATPLQAVVLQTSGAKQIVYTTHQTVQLPFANALAGGDGGAILFLQKSFN